MLPAFHVFDSLDQVLAINRLLAAHDEHAFGALRESRAAELEELADQHAEEEVFEKLFNKAKHFPFISLIYSVRAGGAT